MSERTTGRKMLADLEKRVSVLEGNGAADPLAEIKREIEEATEKLAQRVKSIDRRLSELEAKGAETPPSDPPPVAKASKGQKKPEKASKRSVK